MMVYSASMIGNKYGTFTSGIPVSETYFLRRQAMWVVLAYMAFLVFSVAIPFEVFKDKRYLYVTVHRLINGQCFVFHIFYKIRQPVNSKLNEKRRKNAFC